MKSKKTRSSRHVNSKKHVAVDPEATRIPRMIISADGRIEQILTIKCGWCRITYVDVNYLKNVLSIIEKENKKYDPRWYAIDQELKRRPPEKTRQHSVIQSGSPT